MSKLLYDRVVNIIIAFQSTVSFLQYYVSFYNIYSFRPRCVIYYVTQNIIVFIKYTNQQFGFIFDVRSSPRRPTIYDRTFHGPYFIP